MRLFLKIVLAISGVLAVLIAWFRVRVWLGGRGIPPFEAQALLRPFPQPLDPQLTRLDTHQIEMRWQRPPENEKVTVFGGLSPDQINFAQPLVEAQSPTRLIVPNEGEQRPYFALQIGQSSPQMIMMAERHLPLRKVTNLRDIGGYRTADGRTVAWGKVYRSGDLSRLTAREHGYLDGLGIQLVCDLRSERELAERPDQLPPHIRYQTLPVNEGRDPFRDFFRVILFDRQNLDGLMVNLYVEMVEKRAPAWGSWLGYLAQSENLPVLVHCTAGKDRTGIAIALLLSVLGVDRETIMADYALSNLAFEELFRGFKVSATRLKRFGVPFEQLGPLLAAHPEWLTAAFHLIEQRYGSVENYLLEAAGLNGNQLEQIRQNLLVSPS